MTQPLNAVTIRSAIPTDLPIFFEQQLDPQALYMAGFAPETPDYATYLAHWEKISSNENSTIRTILYGEEVAGNILGFLFEDLPHIGYWLGRDYWGKGIASQGVAQFLVVVPARPMYARVLKDNLGSRRVLEKCGFKVIAEAKAISSTRKVEIEEFVCRLD